MVAPKSRRLAPLGQTVEPLSEATDAKSSLATEASPSSPQVLRTLYSVLLKTRLLEEQVLALSRSGEIPGVALPVRGGEATEVGACIGLQPDDSFASSHPKLAAHVVKGTPLKQVFAELVTQKNQSLIAHTSNGVGSVRVVPPTSSLTGQLDIAAGVAYAYRLLSKPNVVVALADDGLAALGFWHEAASLASRHRLPIVFIVENCAQSHTNGTSVVQSDEDLRDRAEAYGIPGITVDGNDIVAVWRVTQESIHRARTGAGPTLIESRTWRWHTETDGPPTNGRSKSKQPHKRWQNDPLHHMEHYMKKRKLWQQAWKDQLVDEYRSALAAAVNSLQRSPKGR
jgi:pyruvate dehydrogenase E1 component alpha subunit